MDHGLFFGGRGFRRKDQVPVTFNDLNDARRYRHTTTADGPLAVLSACGTADHAHDAPSTIPQTLLDAGYRAVIAPLVSINVPSAMEIATSFFEGISRAETVGESLVLTRVRLLREYSNPLAMLYVCYGEVSCTSTGTKFRSSDDLVVKPSAAARRLGRVGRTNEGAN
jgi:CHAT domain